MLITFLSRVNFASLRRTPSKFCSRADIQPTPALSLGERERRCPTFCLANVLGSRTPLRLFPLLGERVRVRRNATLVRAELQ